MNRRTDEQGIQIFEVRKDPDEPRNTPDCFEEWLDSFVKPRDSYVKPRDSSVKPCDTSVKARDSFVKPRDSSAGGPGKYESVQCTVSNLFQHSATAYLSYSALQFSKALFATQLTLLNPFMPVQ